MMVRVFKISFEVDMIYEFEIRGNYVFGCIIAPQDFQGTFAIAYMDDGCWYLVVFDRFRKIITFNVNEHFKLDYDNLPIESLNNPLATCCFMRDDLIFYGFHKRKTNTFCYFSCAVLIKDKTTHSFNLCNMKRAEFEYTIGTSQLIEIKMESPFLNFPMSSFYSDSTDSIHTFFRRGEVISS